MPFFMGPEKILEFIWKRKRPKIAGLSNPKQKKHYWRYHNTIPQIILQSHSDKDRLVLAEKTDTHINGTRLEDPEINPQGYSYLRF